MGHLTNPTGFRLGRTIKWPYRWSGDALDFAKNFIIIDSGYTVCNYSLFLSF